ncbi:DUF3459 domain-containing protein [Sphingomonas sp. 22L2VL55-3]
MAGPVPHPAQDPPRGDHPPSARHDRNRRRGDRRGAVVARWKMGDGAILTIALNLGDDIVDFPPLEASPIFADGKLGEAASVAVWLDR